MTIEIERGILVKIGYASTNERRTLDAIIKDMQTKAKVEDISFGITSESSTKEQLIKLINRLNTGDIIVVNSLDSLGSTINELIEILTILNQKGLGIQVLEIEMSGEENEALNSEIVQNILKKYLLDAFYLIEEISKADIKKRQSLGISQVKNRTIKKKTQGRPKKYSADAEDAADREVWRQVVDMLKEDISINQIAKELDLSRNTVYRIKEDATEEGYI